MAFLAFANGGGGLGIPLMSVFATDEVTESPAYIEAGQSPARLAEMNSISGFSTGYGLEQRPTTLLSALIQDSFIIALSPPNTDYIEDIADEASLVSPYVVTEGDSLSLIAYDFGISVQSILWLNPNISNPDSLSLGTVLKIPPVSGVVHTVEHGDTLEAVAERYKSNIEDILAYNAVRPGGALIVGSEIIVPQGTLPVKSDTGTQSAHRTFSYLPSLDDFFQTPTTGIITRYIHGRNAVDIADRCGVFGTTPIYSAAAGIITTADNGPWNGGYGQYIVINHANGTETLYAHAQKLFVQSGDSIEKGQLIAEMGNSGQVWGETGCHLHFEVHGAQNPLAKY